MRSIDDSIGISRSLPLDRIKKPSHFNSIQVMRAIAALSVVLYHSGWLQFGYAGVDIFFVISGFVMGTVGGQEGAREFLTKRIIRIVPLYWATTLAMCLISFIPGAFRTFNFDTVTLTKSLLFVPYIDDHGNAWPLIIAGWSLNFEMFFYFIFTIGLLLRAPRVFSSLLIIGLMTVGLIFRPQEAITYTYTNPLLMEFVGGLLLSWIKALSGTRVGLSFLVLGGLLFIATAMSGIIHGSLEWSLSRAIFLGIPAFCLVAGGIALERAGCWPRLRALELVGDASYSLYLLHGIVAPFVKKFIHLGPVLTEIVVIGGSIGLALGSYRVFELPVARFLRRFLARVETRHRA